MSAVALPSALNVLSKLPSPFSRKAANLLVPIAPTATIFPSEDNPKALTPLSRSFVPNVMKALPSPLNVESKKPSSL